MLNYAIACPEELQNITMLKMVLQPIVENAVYHGTKNTRHMGQILVKLEKKINQLVFTVEDNGIGITPAHLEEIKKELAKGVESDVSIGYGLYNVNKRLLLYYGSSAGITLESTYRKGTTVTVTIPIN